MILYKAFLVAKWHRSLSILVLLGSPNFSDSKNAQTLLKIAFVPQKISMALQRLAMRQCTGEPTRVESHGVP